MTTPYPFQLNAIDRIDELKGRALLALPMGCGKSPVAIWWATQNRTAFPVVVVCPASLKWNWRNEWIKHAGMRSEVIEGTKAPKRFGIGDDVPVIIINYDILGPWIPYLQSRNPGLVILDEVHYLKDKRTLRYKSVKRLVEETPYLLALSGTPLTNRPAELWTTLNLLRPKQFRSFLSFANAFCAPRRTPWGWDFSGASNLGRLHQELSRTVMFRKRKEEVLPDLPAKRREVVLVDVDDRHEYDAALTHFLVWLRSKGKDTSRIGRAEKLVQLNTLKHLAAKLKRRAVGEWVDSFLEESDEKLLLYGVHHDIVHHYRDRRKNESVLVTGEVIGKERQVAFDKFNTDQKCRLFVGNIQAAGSGWSARGASTVAFAELDWVPGNHAQAEDRVHGINRGVNGRTCRAVYLVARGTVEEKLADVLQRKQDTVSKVLDGKKGAGDIDTLDLLLRELARGNGR